MVTDKHLAVVRAALKFFVEEMGPHGNSFESYLDDLGNPLEIRNPDLKDAQEQFLNLRSRQVMLDTESNKLVMKQHFATDDAKDSPTPAKRIQYVTLLLPVDNWGH